MTDEERQQVQEQAVKEAARVLVGIDAQAVAEQFRSTTEGIIRNGGTPLAIAASLPIVYAYSGEIHMKYMKSTAGTWRAEVYPGSAYGAVPGQEGNAQVPLTTIASDWCKTSDEAGVQALRRYCDILSS